MGRSVVETSFLGPSPPRKTVRIGITAPLRWIKTGVGDFLQIPVLSIFYGTLLAGVVYAGASLFLSDPVSNLGYVGSLLFFAPFLAAGLYGARRDLESGRAPTAYSSFWQVWTRKVYLALFSLMLTAFIMGWLRLSALGLSLYLDTPLISMETIRNLPAGSDGLLAIGLFAVITVVVAVLIFFVGAVALPLVFDGDSDFVNAMITSYQAARRNPIAMFLWACLVVLLITIGVAVWFVGLVFVSPILGYAAWHSYRDLIK